MCSEEDHLQARKGAGRTTYCYCTIYPALLRVRHLKILLESTDGSSFHFRRWTKVRYSFPIFGKLLILLRHSSTRTRQRSNTLESIASTIISPSNEPKQGEVNVCLILCNDFLLANADLIFAGILFSDVSRSSSLRWFLALQLWITNYSSSVRVHASSHPADLLST